MTHPTSSAHLRIRAEMILQLGLDFEGMEWAIGVLHVLNDMDPPRVYRELLGQSYVRGYTDARVAVAVEKDRA